MCRYPLCVDSDIMQMYPKINSKMFTEAVAALPLSLMDCLLTL